MSRYRVAEIINPDKHSPQTFLWKVLDDAEMEWLGTFSKRHHAEAFADLLNRKCMMADRPIREESLTTADD